MIASNLELHRMATKRDSRVVTALTQLKTHLFKYQGHAARRWCWAGATWTARICSRCTPTARRTRCRSPRWVPVLAAMAVFESDFKENMTEEEAKDLVARSIRAGVFNDLGSGSNVDLCVIKRARCRTCGITRRPTSGRTCGRRVRLPAGNHASEPAELHDGDVGDSAAERNRDHLGGRARGRHGDVTKRSIFECVFPSDDT